MSSLGKDFLVILTKPNSRTNMKPKHCLKRGVCSPAECIHSLCIVLLNFRQKLAERSEASLKVSEFSVSFEGKLTKETVCMDLVEFQKHNGLLPLGAFFPAIFDVVVNHTIHT